MAKHKNGRAKKLDKRCSIVYQRNEMDKTGMKGRKMYNQNNNDRLWMKNNQEVKTCRQCHTSVCDSQGAAKRSNLRRWNKVEYIPFNRNKWEEIILVLRTLTDHNMEGKKFCK